MISIKKLLASDEREAAEAFERMARLLLQAIGLHAVAGDHKDLEDFQTAIAGVQGNLEHDPSPQNILVAAGSAIESLQVYNRRTSAFVQGKTAELNAILGMLTQAMTQIATLSENSVSRLQELQERIEHAAMLEDVRALKARLSECLDSIRAEVARQREESRQLISSLREALESVQARPASAGAEEPGDPLTGLPQKSEAKTAIGAACGPGSRIYAALFVLDRLPTIQSRFGPKAVDEALLFFLQFLSEALSPTDRFFRWEEGSFLALIDRQGAADYVRREIAKAIARRPEQTLRIDGRSVALQLSSTWTVLPLSEHTPAENVKKLEAFCASQART